MSRFRFLKKFVWVMMALLGCAAIFPPISLASGINVYGEGAYTQSELDVYIYADISQDNVLSYGIKLTYDPAVLTVTSAEKDLDPIPYTDSTAKWYLGDKEASYRNNPLPDTSSTPGEVIFIGGKLDPQNPTAGVGQGSRIFIGKVTFTPVGGSMPSNPVLTLALARTDGSYSNFVRIDERSGPVVLDTGEVSFGPVTIAELGDANTDSIFNFQDLLRVKNIAQTGNNKSPFADCNMDGIINFQDLLCIKSKIQ